MSADIQLRINGKDVTPATVPLADLLVLLREFQVAIASTARASGVPKDEVRIALTGIGEGSDLLSFTANDPTIRQAKRVVRAVAKDDPSGLPARARQSVRRMWRYSAAREWELELDSRRNGSVSKAKILPSQEPFVAHRATGSTAQMAQILRAGGERPTAQLRLPDRSIVTAKVTSKQVAEELGHHLYHWVELVGEAQWNTKTWKLEEFHVKGIGDYREKTSDPVRAIEQISLLPDNPWSSLDPETYIRELRSEN